MIVPKLQAPIVLVHGLCGFDRIAIGSLSLMEYFPGIDLYLGQSGNRVGVPCLSPTAGIADRAAQLSQYLDCEFPDEPVHLIAHSMGGLDSRYLITRLGQSERVLSLTTIGTPHRGTAFADWGIQRFDRIIKPLFHWLRWPCQGFFDMTTAACDAFNAETPDAPHVRYFSVAGRCELSWSTAAWLLSYHVVAQAEGPNDGIVSLESARWGEAFEVWEGDHLNLVNWSPLPWLTPDRAYFYGGLVRRLADTGF